MQSYLQKHAISDAMIKEEPSIHLNGIVIIPSFNDMDLLDSIGSLLDCNIPNGVVEIIPILNHSDTADHSIVELHRIQFETIQKLSKRYTSGPIKVHAIAPISLPDKIAGVGLARKIGMDEAVRRFESLGKDGIIFNVDADCICSLNYFSRVFDCFESNSEISALSIGFHHRWDHLDENQQQAIMLYELHLRSYIGWQKFYNYPFAFQTLGSCFAVRSKAYQAQGGMNRRKAGEDFYFLHKYSILGTLKELNEVLVFPSGRISNRVPFGTGKAVHDIIHLNKAFKSYNPKAIHTFCDFMYKVRDSYVAMRQGKSFEHLVSTNSLLEFLWRNSFGESLDMAIQNSSNALSFHKRISRWFDPFCLMKYLHDARETEFPDIEVADAAVALLHAHQVIVIRAEDSIESLLNALRTIDYGRR